MTQAQALLDQLQALGVTVRAQDGRLVLQGPAEHRERFREAVREQKADLLTLLAPCSCEELEGWLYRCPAHQQTPAGRVLAEPLPLSPEELALIAQVAALFAGKTPERTQP